MVGLDIALGALFLLLAGQVAPHEAPIDQVQGELARSLHRAWVFVAAISLRNLPEGLVVALAPRSVGYGRVFSVPLGATSGLLEPVAAVLGAATVAAGLLPWGLAFAVGAMLYAVSHEAIPGAHQQGNARPATAGLVLGFVLMMVLDTAPGAGPG